MDRLIAADIAAKLRYEPGEGIDYYAIDVTESNFTKAADILRSELSLNAEVEDENDDSASLLSEPNKGIFTCPWCNSKKYVFVEEPIFRIILLSVFTLGFAAVIWIIYTRRAGSKLECDTCKHRWRAHPAKNG